MFKDYYHNLKIANINNKKYIVKALNDNVVLKKEYRVMKFIESLEISPKVSKLKENEIIEEFIDGENLHNTDLDDVVIIKLANSINKLHKLDLPKEIREIVQDEFVVDKKYQPLKLFEYITEGISQYIDYRKLKDLFIEYNEYLNTKNYNMGLIHGDLNPGNILLNKEGLFITDWTDCRYDILSCDVSQLFYVFDFKEEQKKMFLKNYSSTYIDNTILEMHYLLFLLFDLSDNFRKTKTLNEEIIEKVNKIIR